MWKLLVTWWFIQQKCNSDTTPDTAKMLLFIEKQANVQILCQKLISFFDPKDPQKIQDVSSNYIGLNWQELKCSTW